MIAFTSLLLSFAIVPVSPNWVVADLNIGILFFPDDGGLAVTHAVRCLPGRVTTNTRYAFGAMRASAQTVTTECFLVFPDGRGGAGRFI